MTLRNAAIAALVLCTMPLSAIVVAYRSYREAQARIRAASPPTLPPARALRR